MLPSYKKNYGKACKPIEIWNRFNLDELLVPIKLMDKNTFLAILKRLFLNWYKYRSGFPDLILFNKEILFFSEVKSENDRISDNQKRWHRFLVEKLDLKVDLFLISHSHRKIKNIKSSYMFLNKEFIPDGDINDFNEDMDVLKIFIIDLTRSFGYNEINVKKNENFNRNIISEIRKINKEIKFRKKELNKELKVLNSDVIIVTPLRNHNNPLILKYDIALDQEILNQFINYYDKIN